MPKKEEDTELALMPMRPIEFSDITTYSSVDEVVSDDLAHINGVLANIRAAWTMVYNIDQVCKLTTATLTTLKARRQALFVPVKSEDKGTYYAQLDEDE